MVVPILPDILEPGLEIVFCGTAVGTKSAERGHYYAGPGNKFWQLLFEAGFTRSLLAPEDDNTLPLYGLGLTDLVKDVFQSHDKGLDFSRADELEARLAPVGPRWVAFTSLEAGIQAAKVHGSRRPRFGEQDWTVGGADVFILPSPSGRNARGPWDGRETKLQWWREFAEISGRA